jgi:hypothetical protein
VDWFQNLSLQKKKKKRYKTIVRIFVNATMYPLPAQQLKKKKKKEKQNLSL